MKHFVTVVITGALVIFAQGCNNQNKASFNTADSLSAAKKYVIDHPDQFFTIAGTLTANQIVPQSELEKMRAAYLQNPLNIADPTGKALTGFVLQAGDLADIVKNGNLLKTIGFHFGIRNYNYRQDQQQPYYTLLVIPVGTNGQPYPPLPGAAASTLSTYGYDFVQPCPGSPGCPN